MLSLSDAIRARRFPRATTDHRSEPGRVAGFCACAALRIAIRPGALRVLTQITQRA